MAETNKMTAEAAQELLELAKRSTELSQVGRYNEAIELATKALHIRENILGSEHPDVAVSLLKLAYLYRQNGDYAGARTRAQRALNIDQKAFGEQHEAVGDCFDVLGGIERDAADLKKSDLYYRHALRIKEATRGPDDLSTANTLNNLALTCKERADYANAESLYRRALQIKETALGKSHPETATALSNLASLYEEVRDFNRAEPLFKNALEIAEKAFGTTDPRIIPTVNGLASFYHDMSEDQRAEVLYRRVVDIAEKAFGRDALKTSTALHNLAAFYTDVGNLTEAQRLLRRVLNITETTLGNDNLSTAATLAYLAQISAARGDYDEAEQLYGKAWELEQRLLGPEHPVCAATAGLLGKIYLAKGDYRNAESLLQKAAALNEQVYGATHRNTGAAVELLARLALARGQRDDALRYAKRVRAIEDRELQNVLSFATETQRLSFSATCTPSLLATLGSPTDVAQAVLRWKGATLDSLIRDRNLATVANELNLKSQLDALRLTRERFFEVSYGTTMPGAVQTLQQREQTREQLLLQGEAIETEIAKIARAAKTKQNFTPVSTARVQAALSDEEALIEFLRYDHYVDGKTIERRYGAVVILRNGAPEWVPLGNAAEIENNIKGYKEYVRGEGDAQAALVPALRMLHDTLWLPVARVLPAHTNTIAISPDGELNFVSFATLLDSENKFLAEKYSVRYLASGRDLLRDSKPTSNQMAVVFANPNFDETSSPNNRAEGGVLTATRPAQMRELQNISLPPLPGTDIEANALERLLEKTHVKVKIFRGAEASKLELLRLQSPRILHIATHGFFLPETEFGGEPNLLQLQILSLPTSKPKLVDPMYRSGIALAGAQRTLRSWSRGEIPPMENNGILTAEEAGGLKLNGTWLVVLSGCDTGFGEARAGEGVLGLRRGFIQAGAQNLLMTLWPIGDRTTVEIMLAFYETAEKTGNAPQALADVQRKWLVKLRDERGLRTAVRFAGPFIMSSQGHL